MKGRAAIAAGCIAVMLAAPSTAESSRAAVGVKPFHGTVVTFKSRLATVDLGEVRARIHLDYDDKCSAASGCTFVWIDVRRTGSATDRWRRVSIDPFKFPRRMSFWDGAEPNDTIMDYAHMYEDYNQSAVVTREERGQDAVLTVYVASREIGEIAPDPGPVDIVKFELMPPNIGGASHTRTSYHLAPVASMRSKATYNNAQLALFCEIGLEAPGLRANLNIQGDVECPPQLGKRSR
jgi:hypothetical protein